MRYRNYGLQFPIFLGYTLLHRYSFNDGTASDSVGGSAYAGSLMAGATVTNNQASFTTSGPYVNLPSGLSAGYMALSVEAWVTTGVNTGWTRIYQFGTSAASNTNSFGIFRQNGPNSFALMWQDVFSTWNTFTSSVQFDSQTNVHVVVTAYAFGYASLYINGILQGSIPVVSNPIPMSTIFYIGKSFDSTAGFIGSVNEFRIWGGALSATDIATRYSQGPGET